MKKLLLAIMLLASLSFVTEAKVIYVNSTATGTANGTSWTNGYTDLQVAINSAASGDEVWVKEGLYRPSVDLQGTLPAQEELRTFYLKDGVEVLGGFQGVETSVVQRDAAKYKATLEGLFASNKQAYHVLTVSTNSSSVIDGFIVKNGKAVGTGLHSYGAGVYLTGSAKFVNIEFYNNVAQLQGGAVYSSGSISQFIACRFESNNVLTYDGGAAYLNSSSNSFHNCVFYKNTAARYGGIITAVNSNAVLQNASIAKNTGVNNLFQTSKTSGTTWSITINHSVIWDNTGTSSGSQSGTSVVYNNCLSQWGCSSCININPQFSDVLLGDLTLQANSPAVDTLTANAVNNYSDIAGNARVFGNLMDLGAYEQGANTNVPSVIYVAHNATGTADGSSWVNAFTDLQAAIRNANFGDDVWVKEGTYYPTITTSGILPAAADRTFWLKNNVRVLGGFVGTETMETERNPALYKATLDGQITPNIKANHVLTVSAGSSAELDGFIVKNGYASPSTNVGGGLLLTGSVKFLNIIFKSNTAYQQGGAVYASGATSEFVNCRFESNTATVYDGGAIYATTSDLKFYNCVFYKNTAARYGGIATAVSSNITMKNNTFVNNQGGNNVFQVSNTIGGTWKISITESVIWGNVGTSAGTQNGTTFELTNSVSQWSCTNCSVTDPMLTNVTSGDLSLKSSSPAIDNVFGSTSHTYAKDIAGEYRVVGTTVDFGAYEYQVISSLSSVEANELSIYPNPVAGSKVSLSKSADWKLFTSQGALLLEGQGDSIEVAPLSKGVYFVEVITNGERVVKSFVKN